jgi:hypothetical protein
VVDSPTLFLAGERGPEAYAFAGAGNTSFSGGSGGEFDGRVYEAIVGLRADMAARFPEAIAMAVRDVRMQRGRR